MHRNLSIRRRGAVGATIVALVVLALAPSSLAAPAQALTGSVTDGDGAPLSSICVSVDDSSTPPGSGTAGSALTAVDGTYRVPVAEGTYRVRFSDCRTVPTHVTQWWKDQPTAETSDAVTVGGSDVELGTTVLRAGVAVSGTVLGPDLAAQPGTHVTVVSIDGGASSSAVSGPDGSYRTGPLPSGDYSVRFDGPDGEGQPTQYWSSAWMPSAAATLRLDGPSSEVAGVDASMVEGSTFEGRVTDDAGNGVSNICVAVYARTDGAPGDRVGSANTDADGRYRVVGLPPVEALVQFSDCSGSGYVTEWHTDAPSASEARVMYLQPGAALSGVDATLARGATVSGIVTDEAGAPLAGICVNAVGDGSDSDGGGAGSSPGANTDRDGRYRLDGIGTDAVRVHFEDCTDQGPFLDQWFDGSATEADATPITLPAGASRGGVDARMVRAGTVSGHVTATSGPLSEICVQASDDQRVAAYDETDGDGSYQLAFDRSGSYRIQFVDCSDDPRHVGRWWGGGSTRSSATPVEVTLGEDVHDISVQLVDGPAGAVAGQVTNVRGQALTRVCAVVYLADGEVKFAPVDAEGRYSVPGVGSGTWAVGFLDCTAEELAIDVRDPEVPSIAYRAQWLGGRPLMVDDDGDEGPDPVGQGATLLEVPSGGVAAADTCFGCGLLDATVAVAADVATFRFGAPDLLDGADVRSRATDAAIDYRVTCTAEGRPSLTSATVDAVDGPVGVVGLSAGVAYGCTVAASVGGIVVADSTPLAVASASSVAALPGTDGSARSPGTAAGGTDEPTARQLAFTGSGLLPLLVLSLVLLAGGLFATGAATARLVRLARSSRRS